MDIKELDKKQLILLTLLITFVVSIATGIVTVSLMNQMPKSVPQTINNVIQRTIEKVSTVEAPTVKDSTVVKTQDSSLVFSSNDVLVPIYINSDNTSSSVNTPILNNTEGTTTTSNLTATGSRKELGQGVIISDVGLILVDSSVLTESQKYIVVLNKIDFEATVLKKFSNGFAILKISDKKSAVKTIDQFQTATDSTI